MRVFVDFRYRTAQGGELFREWRETFAALEALAPDWELTLWDKGREEESYLDPQGWRQHFFVPHLWEEAHPALIHLTSLWAPYRAPGFYLVNAYKEEWSALQASRGGRLYWRYLVRPLWCRSSLILVDDPQWLPALALELDVAPERLALWEGGDPPAQRAKRLLELYRRAILPPPKRSRG